MGNDAAVSGQLEKLGENITELLKFSQKSNDSHREANELYKSKYGNLTVAVYDGLRKNREIKIINNRLAVGPDIFHEFLIGFGQSIENLSINYYFISAAKYKEIGKWINTYCSETLVEFKVEYYMEGGFDEMETPFKKVERMAFDGLWRNLSANKMAFNELFPEMRVLNLSRYSDGHIFDCNYKNLIELNTDVEPTVNFRHFFEKNSQIEKLRLVKLSSMEQLQTINDKLPNVHILSFCVPIDLLTYQGPNITFEHIREVTVRDFNYKMRAQKIAFKQLKQLELSINLKIDGIWIDFISSNKGLKTLIITDGELTNSTITELSTRINGLVEADIRCDSNVEIKTIEYFLRSNPLMKKTILNFPKGSILYISFLNNLLKNKWTVVSMNKQISQISITKSDLTSTSENITNSALTTEDSPSSDVVTENITNSTLTMEDSLSTDVVTENITNSTLTMEAITTISESHIYENGASNIFSSIILRVSLIAIVISTIVF